MLVRVATYANVKKAALAPLPRRNPRPLRAVSFWLVRLAPKLCFELGVVNGTPWG